MSEHKQNSTLGPDGDKKRNFPPSDNSLRPADQVGDRPRAEDGGVPARSGVANSPVSGRAGDGGAGTPAITGPDPGINAILDQVRALNWQLTGNVRFSREQEAILRQPVDPDWVEIKYPDVPYLPVAYFRKILNDAFGPGAWALVEIGKPNRANEIYYLPCVLVAEGKPVAKAVGECEIKGGNRKLTDGDAVEACRSNAITRCCKSLGIAEELHWPAWVRKFKREHCIELERDRFGNIVIARKDDEAGAKLFRDRIEADEMSRTGGDPYIRQFTEHAAAIKQEDDSWMQTPIVEIPEDNQ